MDNKQLATRRLSKALGIKKPKNPNKFLNQKIRNLEFEPIDILRSKKNPWGLGPCQCYVLRMYCIYGNNKRTINAIDTSAKNIEHHLLVSRKKMGFIGSDIRLFLQWNTWVTQLELFNEHRT